jgi:hypothetical protein
VFQNVIDVSRLDIDRTVFLPFDGYNVRQQAATRSINQQLAKY